jgi:hypothetical protein
MKLMGDASDQILQCEPDGLRKLLEESAPWPWSKEDYPHVLAHELATPLRAELGALASEPGASRRRDPWLDRTFGELFSHPDPPGPLLRQVKDFAKGQRTRNGHLPKEVATVLYYAAVAVALCKLSERITTLTDNELLTGFDWVLEREWIPEDLKPVLVDARRRLSREAGTLRPGFDGSTGNA